MTLFGNFESVGNTECHKLTKKDDPRPHLRTEKFLLKGDFTFQDKKCQKIESLQEFVIFQEFQTKKIDSHQKPIFSKLLNKK